MEQQENITIQTLVESKDVQIGYSDNDIIIIDNIQRFEEFSEARVAMNSIIVCKNGRIQAEMNGQPICLQKNQVAIVPENFIATNVMVSPDIDIEGMFFTTRILQSFLREKMNVWNEMMFIRRLHVISMDDDDLVFYSHFYQMLNLYLVRGKDDPFRTDIVQSLLRSAILGMCGSLRMMLPQFNIQSDIHTPAVHFQRFLDLLHNERLNPHTVEAYANKLCISPKYLTAICKKQSGKTANEWIREKLLEDIRYYLRQTDLSVKQVADQLGFSNPSFFGKFVKEHFGMTPLQIRQKNISADPSDV